MGRGNCKFFDLRRRSAYSCGELGFDFQEKFLRKISVFCENRD
jgi:hypothetical protein